MVAGSEENQEAASEPVDSPESAATSKPAGHGEEEPVVDPLANLTSSGIALLDVSLDVLKDFFPEGGALDDIPQVSISKEHTLEACRLIKEDPRTATEMLLCLACVDYSEYFQMVYILQSLKPERTLVLRTTVPYLDTTVPSVTSVWRAADWYEREAHDLFGVSFDGHPDMSPLLLYEGFEGFPGRKEFPFNEYQEF
ncbi:MAG: NADH-quinone oxidoreductase subunit C [SAR202 cluster bacterium]|nr:NADH-quinone oxidoreductase subunit C [SAR202 cluster bacterium]MQG64371.1 NADH-quinone oxidoreductase subunit C [SAR202 cluster bacterium]